MYVLNVEAALPQPSYPPKKLRRTWPQCPQQRPRPWPPARIQICSVLRNPLNYVMQPMLILPNGINCAVTSVVVIFLFLQFCMIYRFFCYFWQIQQHNDGHQVKLQTFLYWPLELEEQLLQLSQWLLCFITHMCRAETSNVSAWSLHALEVIPLSSDREITEKIIHSLICTHCCFVYVIHDCWSVPSSDPPLHSRLRSDAGQIQPIITASAFIVGGVWY